MIFIFYFIGVIFVGLSNKNPIIIYGHNKYTINKRMKNGIIRWRCTQYFKTKCRNTLATCDKTVTVNYHEHNHPPTSMGLLKHVVLQNVTIIKKAK